MKMDTVTYRMKGEEENLRLLRKVTMIYLAIIEKEQFLRVFNKEEGMVDIHINSLDYLHID